MRACPPSPPHRRRLLSGVSLRVPAPVLLQALLQRRSPAHSQARRQACPLSWSRGRRAGPGAALLGLMLLLCQGCQPAAEGPDPFAGLDLGAEEQRCGEGDRGACALLIHYHTTPWGWRSRQPLMTFLLGLSGWLLSAAEPPQPPYAAMLEYARRGCELEHGFACGVAARLYTLGRGTELDFREGFALTQRSCALKFGGGCTLLGDLLLFGSGTEQDYQAAQDAYEEACVLGDQSGCARLFYLLGQRPGAALNLPLLRHDFAAMWAQEARRIASGERTVCISAVGLRSNAQVPDCLSESFRVLSLPQEEP